MHNYIALGNPRFLVPSSFHSMGYSCYFILCLSHLFRVTRRHWLSFKPVFKTRPNLNESLNLKLLHDYKQLFQLRELHTHHFFDQKRVTHHAIRCECEKQYIYLFIFIGVCHGFFLYLFSVIMQT